MSDLKAFHEAGHAVAATVLRFHVVQVELDARGGSCSLDLSAEYPDERRGRASEWVRLHGIPPGCAEALDRSLAAELRLSPGRLIELAAESMAGRFAQARVDPPAWHCPEDQRFEASAWRSQSTYDRAQFMGQACELAGRLVVAHWDCIVRVARELCARGRLEGERVRSLVAGSEWIPARAPGPPSRDPGPS